MSAIAERDYAMVEHELANDGKPWVLVKQLSWQSGFAHLPGVMFYNVVAGDYAVGSTVTIKTLLAQGYRVEVVA